MRITASEGASATHDKEKRQTTEWEEVFAIMNLIQKLISGNVRGAQETQQSQNKWAKQINTRFSKMKYKLS